MNVYELLLLESEENSVIVVEKYFKSKAKGLCKNNKIGISKKLVTTIEKSCILAEELGHYHTTTGNILDQSKIENRKQELKARRWAVKKLIRVEQFIDAFEAGVTNRYELAEFLDVTEEFIDTAIEHFQRVYGHSYTIGAYTIYFSPLCVYKSFE
ncbi:MAG: ImmA/IrrE family metallo-endopeptidase [Clostridiaceae bacterium]|nr:ImmA/IrrE family metallo-endopeptidase [Clostridiaceae bacterium]